MNKIQNAELANVFNHYPKPVRLKLMTLRQLILDTATENNDIGEIEETLKWGEPSYIAKKGSTVRIGWKPKTPEQYRIYFHCKTTLVETFKALYQGVFQFEGNREIIFSNNDNLPAEQLKHCILLALTYHSRKHLPMLGA